MAAETLRATNAVTSTAWPGPFDLRRWSHSLCDVLFTRSDHTELTGAQRAHVHVLLFKGKPVGMRTGPAGVWVDAPCRRALILDGGVCLV